MNQTEEPSEQQPSEKPKPSTAGPIITGILLVILGIIFVIAQFFGRWFFNDYWPFILIAGGLIFYAAYFVSSRKPPGYEGMLFPGTYLIVLGLLFFIANFIGWSSLRYLWPTFVLGVALSLGAMYIFGPREPSAKRKDLFSSIKILFAISVVLYIIACGGYYLWPLALILIGLLIIYKGLRRR